jgi:hypothetical protein
MAGQRASPASTGGSSGARIYAAACAACHGIDGRGAPSAVTALSVPVPDFTECQFAAREPNDDWIAVAHSGGPTRGFAPMMPAFGDALSIDEIELAVTHVRTLCTDRSWPRGELNLPRPLVTGKAYPEDEAVVTVTAATRRPAVVTTEVLYERRIGPRNQVEIAVPFAVTTTADGWTGHVGDVAVGAKRALYHSLPRGRIVSAAAEAILPTGRADTGLGSGVTVLEPFLAFGQILPRGAFLQLQAGAEFPLGDNRATDAFWRGALGTTVVPNRFGRAWSPMIEILGARELARGHSARWELVPQVQVTLNTRQHVMLNGGVRIPASGASPRTARLMIYLLWDWFDGGFLEGW